LTFALDSPTIGVKYGGRTAPLGVDMTLTKRQKEVLNYLVGFLNKNGYSPSFEEIAHALKLTSLATVHKHLSTLEKKGYIRRGYNQSRSIEVVQLPKPIREQVLDRHVVELPLAGRISAGQPLEAVESNETISLADFARGAGTFVLQVKGESMRDDHILDGDYIVVEQTQVANHGEIVVALVGEDDATVKRFFREPGGKVRLQPANSAMAPIIVPGPDVKIQGRVVGVLRKYS
jgi:repressor LexA